MSCSSDCGIANFSLHSEFTEVQSNFSCTQTKWKILDAVISKWTQVNHFWIQKLQKNGSVYFQKDQHMNIKVALCLLKIPELPLVNAKNKIYTKPIHDVQFPMNSLITKLLHIWNGMGYDCKKIKPETKTKPKDKSKTDISMWKFIYPNKIESWMIFLFKRLYYVSRGRLYSTWAWLSGR